MNADLPYVAEYAKSGRASCKTCKNTIDKDSLRIGVMVQSPNFDGKIPLWHHSSCFLKKNNIKNVADIANFDNLRWEDQKRIKENKAEGPAGGSKKGKGGGKGSDSEFSVEYAKSGRAGCRECGEKILKGQIRISKMIYDTPEAKRYGPMPGWRHVDCFVKARLELEFPDSADKLPGFKTLEDEDQKMLKDKIGSLRTQGVKKKAEEEEPPEAAKRKKTEEAILKSQNELIFQMRDQIKANLAKKEIVELLEYNKQHVSPAEQNNRDILADCLVFGAIETCSECKNSAPRFKIDSYRCGGNLTEWTKCQFVTKIPARKPFKVPEEYKEKYDFLREYKYVKRDRHFAEKEDTASSLIKKGPLNGYIICVFGKFQSPKSAVEKKVMELGGALSQKVNESVQCCISTKGEVEKEGAKVKQAHIFDIHIVSPKFLDDIKNGSTPAISIKENTICSWGGDPILKFGIKEENKLKRRQAESSSSNLYKSETKKLKITVQGAAAVDPDSGMENKCHVYQKKDDIYNCVLGMVDVSRGMNTYYKLQLLEANKKAKYYLFRSWGRVGTKIGNNKLEEMKNVSDGIATFENFYLDKTGNHWSDRKKFVKKPGLFYPIDIDYGQECKELKELKPGANSKLPQAVQELICLIFDIEAMKKAMVEFEIDLKKMPLGKLSKKQIESAYSVLSEAQEILMTGSNANKILDVSNRFYTLIPHDFGLKTPPLLDNEELIKSKIEMLDSLLEIEFAYNMMKSENESSTKDPVDEHYEKLQTDIEVLDDKCNEFDIIKTYLKNTHAETHNMYTLKLNKVFKINRHGEGERYTKYKDLHNKKLLWHGSRLTNYVGILSQGLRIAPPEAPVTGYMFGKGIYFADMVSKSANYCFTNRKNNTGLLLLCEVALGNMYEKTCAEFVEKLPKNKHSTKGLGMTVPDPKDKTFIDDAEVPYGKPTQSDVGNSSLLYNEYIVYDVNQVNIKYLLDVSFKYK